VEELDLEEEDRDIDILSLHDAPMPIFSFQEEDTGISKSLSRPIFPLPSLPFMGKPALSFSPVAGMVFMLAFD